jgi:hypothetical protein
MSARQLSARIARLEHRASTAIGQNPARDLLRFYELSRRQRLGKHLSYAQSGEYWKLSMHFARQDRDRDRARWKELSQQDAARLTDDERAELAELMQSFPPDPIDST